MATTTQNDSGMDDYGFNQEAQMYPIEDRPDSFRFALFQVDEYTQESHFAHPHFAHMFGRMVAMCNPSAPLMFVSAWSKHELTVCRACISHGKEYVENLRSQL